MLNDSVKLLLLLTESAKIYWSDSKLGKVNSFFQVTIASGFTVSTCHSLNQINKWKNMELFTLCSIPLSHVCFFPHTVLNLQQKLLLVRERMLYYTLWRLLWLLIVGGEVCSHFKKKKNFWEVQFNEKQTFKDAQTTTKLLRSSRYPPYSKCPAVYYGFPLYVTCLKCIFKCQGSTWLHYWNVFQFWILINLFILSIAFCPVMEDLLKDLCSFQLQWVSAYYKLLCEPIVITFHGGTSIAYVHPWLGIMWKMRPC